MPLGKDVLSKIISDRLSLDFGRLKRDYFVQDELEAYDFIAKYVTRYHQLPDAKTTAKECGLIVTADEQLYPYLRDKLVERYKVRRILDIAPDLNQHINDDKPDDAIALLRKVSTELTLEEGIGRDIFTLRELGQMVVDFVRDARGRTMTGIPTGWPSLDRATLGYQGGDLYVVLARVKVGKSLFIFLSSMAAALAGHKVLVISMEMNALQSARRMVAAHSKMDMNAIRSGRLSDFGLRKLENDILTLSENLIFVQGQFRKDIFEIATIINAIQPEIVFIDGGYLIKVLKRMPSSMARWEAMTEVAEGIKTLASTCGIPFVVSFQFNRQVKRDSTKNAGFEQIQLADAIGQLASVGIGMFEDEENENQRLIEIIGGREGETASFKINWDWTAMNFDEIEERRYYDEVEPEVEGDTL